MTKAKKIIKHIKQEYIKVLIILAVIIVFILHINSVLDGSYYETRYEVVEMSGVKFLKDHYTQELKPIIQTNKNEEI